MTFILGFITGGIVVPLGIFIWAFWEEILESIHDLTAR